MIWFGAIGICTIGILFNSVGSSSVVQVLDEVRVVGVVDTGGCGWSGVMGAVNVLGVRCFGLSGIFVDILCRSGVGSGVVGSIGLFVKD